MSVKELMRIVVIVLLTAPMVLSLGCKTEGCTDQLADNYSSEADEDDGSCEYSAELVFYCDFDRSRELNDEGFLSPIELFVNDVSIGRLDFYKTVEAQPDCADNFDDFNQIEVLNHSHQMLDADGSLKLSIQDNVGLAVREDYIEVTAKKCTSIKI